MGEVPLHLRQALRGPAHQLVTPVRGALKAKEQRRVLSAVRAAQRMRMTGAHWLLLTTEREAFGSSDNARSGAFYEVLEQILAEHLRTSKKRLQSPRRPAPAEPPAETPPAAAPVLDGSAPPRRGLPRRGGEPAGAPGGWARRGHRRVPASAAPAWRRAGPGPGGTTRQPSPVPGRRAQRTYPFTGGRGTAASGGS